MIIPLYSVLVGPHLECCAHYNVVKGLEHLFYKMRLRDLELFSLDKKRFWEILEMYVNS